MKKLCTIFAAVFALWTFVVPAAADVGKPGQVYWNGSVDSVGFEPLMLRGDTACDGSEWQYVCTSFSKRTNELTVHYVGRARKGVSLNYSTWRIASSTPNAFIVRNEAGEIVTVYDKTGAAENGRARMYDVLAAFTNGGLASVISGTVCAVGGCGKRSGDVIAIAGATATQSGGGNCGGGLCK